MKKNILDFILVMLCGILIGISINYLFNDTRKELFFKEVFVNCLTYEETDVCSTKADDAWKIYERYIK